jgi:hypothetical protein
MSGFFIGGYMDTYMSMRRQILKDRKRIEKYNRNNRGRFTKTQMTFREEITWGNRKLQWIFSLASLVFITFILLKPIELYNPLISIETVKSVEAAMPSNSNEEADLENRIEECWNRGWIPGVLETGFVCAAPAVELSTK